MSLGAEVVAGNTLRICSSPRRERQLDCSGRVRGEAGGCVVQAVSVGVGQSFPCSVIQGERIELAASHSGTVFAAQFARAIAVKQAEEECRDSEVQQIDIK
jgi:hypothetical protein